MANTEAETYLLKNICVAILALPEEHRNVLRPFFLSVI